MSEPKKFTTLRAFLEEAIDGRIGKAEAIEMLDQIEEGVGLQEHERQLAEAMEQLPEDDARDPVYQRGFEEGAGGLAFRLFPMLEKCEWVGGRCPMCGYETVHKRGCLLDGLLVAERARKAQMAAEEKMNAGAPVREDMPTS